MQNENVGYLFFVPVVILVAWACSLVLTRILRRTGVIPYPSFTSRKEYLDAALEMNLEDFIGRAKATPRHVIEKPPPEEKSAHFTLIEEAEKVLATWKSRQPTMGKDPDLKPTVGGVVGGTKKGFAVGQWVRFTDDICASLKGKLGRIDEVHKAGYKISDERGKWGAYDGTFEPAAPSIGEWWRWTKYDVLHGVARHLEPFPWAVHDPLAKEEVEAGNLEPVNFGKGGLTSEPVPKPEKSRGWFRNKHDGTLIYRAADHLPGSGWYHYNRGDSSVQLLLARHEVEVAYPKLGEWWHRNHCVKHPCPPACLIAWKINAGPWVYDPNELVECGCIVPVNYGKGLEQKSGVA